ncbi:uncharacterized protein PV09_01974 [Verruconis gallopava]|uniref:Uncharacterized protein n=1 Tax=Verruconis gallopava TaxID=253628 RepID=A0A0D2AKJ8_9PEZI|nr:uncharacterized protein PV09_01974 [Verruconis gallopava]KIW07090.1 hypothetical protein PV09_01974 [Verruconis gallopava]
MASLQTLRVVNGVSIGPFTIGASIHHVLGRVKTDPAAWPKIHVKYSTSEPLLHPIVVELPANGLRLNFDPAEQRLRFIEVLDFSKVRLQHGEHTINRLPAGNDEIRALPTATAQAGPDFKHVYKEFGPSNPGEYVGDDGKAGTYCISFKEGIAFLFPITAPEGFSKLDFVRQVAVLDSSACGPATAMVVFRGRSWPLARRDIYTADLSDLPLAPGATGGRREGMPAETELARVRDRGRVELLRRDVPPFMIRLGETTQQDLLTELGPPDSMFKQDRSKAVGGRKRRTSSMSSRRSGLQLDGHDRTGGSGRALSETDSSDAWSDEDEDEDETVVNEAEEDADVGTWWNYYSHGIDVLIAQAHQVPARSPTAPQDDENDVEEPYRNVAIARNHLTVTKICIHGNIPGSWQFNRHRRLRWTLESWPLPEHAQATFAPVPDGPRPLTSETKFRDIQSHLRAVFADTYASPLEEAEQQQPQAFNRDWGENACLGNSVELLGGFEDGGSRKRGASAYGAESEYVRLGEVLVYGFPGLAFEVLKNGCVAWLQVW